jgi:hypothetical protein
MCTPAKLYFAISKKSVKSIPHKTRKYGLYFVNRYDKEALLANDIPNGAV